MAEMDFSEAIVNMIKTQERVNIISEIKAFANEYHHHVDGRDVVIVEQLLNFLTPVTNELLQG